SGVIRNITGKEGVDIPVGSPVAWIYAEGEPASALPGPSAREGVNQARQQEAAAAPEAAEETGSALPTVRPVASDESSKLRATPLARRIAREMGLDLATLSGSGPHGRVVKADVEAALAGGGAGEGKAAAAAGAAPPRPMSDEAVLKLFAEGSYELVPHDNMRKTIARRLVEAKSTIPHFYLTVDCELDALLALRAELNAAAPVRKTETGEEPAYRISVNDMIIKALALALQAVPEANVSWTEEAMVRHRHADVGVAVSIPGGLITPIVRRAEEKSLSAISNEMKDLAARARNRKLKPEEYQGGTTAV